MRPGTWLAAAVIVIVACVCGAEAQTPRPDLVEYSDGRLTVSVTAMPLDRLIAEIAAATSVVVRGSVTTRAVTIDFTRIKLADGLTRIFGAESFMLTYADGQPRTMTLLGQGTGGTMPSSPAVALGAPTPKPPLADEEEKAAILQRPVTLSGPLSNALGTRAPIGSVLHATVQQGDADARAGARDAVLGAMVSDPEIATAYLSTLTPVADAVLADMLRTSSGADGAAEEWMTALVTRAPNEALRQKAAAVLAVLQATPER